MSFQVQIKKDVGFLHIVEDMERLITEVVERLQLNVNDPINYPTLIVTGIFPNTGIIADRLRIPRNITLAGAIGGTAPFDGSGDIVIETTLDNVAAKYHNHISADIVDATSANISEKIVKRDQYGNFAASTIAANLVGNVTGNVNGNITTQNINGIPTNMIFETNNRVVRESTNTTFISNVPISGLSLTGHKHNANDIDSGTLHGDRGVTSGSANSSFVRYTGQFASAGGFNGGVVTPMAVTRLNYEGYFYATRIYNAVYNDYAEGFIPEIGLKYNEIKHRIVEVNEFGKIRLAEENSDKVIGIVSNQYAQLLGASEDEIQNNEKIPVGLVGTLYVDSIEKVDQKNIGSFIYAGNEGKCLVVPKTSISKYQGKIVGKIINVDDKNNRYKVLLTLK